MNDCVLGYFIEDLQIDKHFEALRRYMLMQDGEFALAVGELLFEKVIQCRNVYTFFYVWRFVQMILLIYFFFFQTSLLPFSSDLNPDTEQHSWDFLCTLTPFEYIPVPHNWNSTSVDFMHYIYLCLQLVSSSRAEGWNTFFCQRVLNKACRLSINPDDKYAKHLVLLPSHQWGTSSRGKALDQLIY